MAIRFLHPWMLALGLAPIVLLVLLYLLKLRRHELEVSAVFLWRRSIDDLRANAPLQRLHTNVLFWLQLLALGALTLALAEPVGRPAGRRAHGVVLVVDRSASMSTPGREGTRLARAVAGAERLVAGLERGDRVGIVSFGGGAKVELALTDDRVRARRALRALAVRPVRGRLGPALGVALSMAKGEAASEIHVFSDGAVEALSGEDVAELTGGAALPPLVFHRVGAERANAGITALSVRKVPDAPGRFQVFVGVRSFGSERFLGEIELYLGREREPADLIPVEVGPEGEDARVFEIDARADTPVRLRLAPVDAFALDNEAWVVIREPRAERVLVVTEANYFLERALTAAPDYVVAGLKPAELPKEAEELEALFGRYAVTILDRTCPANLPWGRYLLIGAAPPWPGWKAGEEAEGGGRVLDWSATHAVMRFVDARELFVGRARAMEVPPGAAALLETEAGVVGAALETDRERVVALSFDLYRSNWPLLRSFPVFVRNALGWLSGPGSARVALMARSGVSVESPVAGPVRLVSPGGRELEVGAEPGQAALLPAPEELGFWTVEGGGGERTQLGVSLLDAEESDIRARDALQLGPDVKIAATREAMSPRRWWPLLAAAALGLLVAEWLLYVRRVRLR
jgi:hypothetical protein